MSLKNLWWLISVKGVHSIAESMYLNQVSAFQNCQKNFIYFGRTLTFLLKKSHKNIKFSDFFTSIRSFGGYCQWNVSTHIQKICIWTRHQQSKFVREIPIFLVALTVFGFRKIPWKSKFLYFFTSERHSGGYF